jgi:hypothetical protein
VNRGGSFIVSASDGTPNINDQDFWSMMPVDISGPAGRETQIKVTQEHDMLQDVVFDNIMVKKYYNVAERDNLTKTLIGASAFQNPIIAYREQGEGYVAYVGVNSDPAWSNLYYSSSFPIFWGQMMKYFTRLRGSTTATSLRTGEYLQLPQAQGIRTPAGAYLDSRNVFLDKAGVYEVSYADRTEKVTVNLLNAQETNTSGMVVDDIKDSAGYKISRQNVEVSVELFRYLLSLMLALIIIELLLYRRRGLL